MEEEEGPWGIPSRDPTRRDMMVPQRQYEAMIAVVAAARGTVDWTGDPFWTTRLETALDAFDRSVA